MFKKIFFILLCCPLLWADPPQDILLNYIQTGLKSNLAVQQETFSLKKSMAALKEARGMFLPSVTFHARYSRAGGGRVVEFPVGDLVNPIHSSLNELYSFQGIHTDFPTDVPNESFPFYRPREQDTKLRLIQPLFNAAILHNYKIKSKLVNIQESQLLMYKRQLITDIKIAYFNYLKSIQLVKLLQETEKLLQENYRVSEKLVQNQMATQDVTFRARAAIAELHQQQAEAGKNKQMAMSYFNFLLNRPLTTAIDEAEEASLTPPPLLDFEAASSHALTNRAELVQMEALIRIESQQVKLAKSKYLPTLSAVIDLGIEGEEYGLGKDYDYWMVSLLCQWNIFNGNQDRHKKRQAVLEKKRVELQLEELKRRIILQVQEAYQNLIVAKEMMKTSEERRVSANKSFNIVDQKYKNGIATQVEYLDARNTMTAAAVNEIVNRYEFYSRCALFEKAAARINPAQYLE